MTSVIALAHRVGRASQRSSRRGVAARSLAAHAVLASATLLVAACSDTLSVPSAPAAINPLFQSYVALGNSITAGYQSGGINDSTQRESYARLFATQVKTRYAYASLAGAGCIAPVTAFGAASPDTICHGRASTSFTDRLNNVAVPGASSIDPTSPTTANSNGLTLIILGGKTQVQKAAETQPTFVSVWIGNNDVLPAALSGYLNPTPGLIAGAPPTSPGITPLDTFEANYNLMLNQLRAIPTLKGGVLIGVVQVANAPSLVRSEFFTFPGVAGALSAATGRAITVQPSCATAGALVSLRILNTIATTPSFPAVIACDTTTNPAPVARIFVLTPSEQLTLSTRINQYNTFIHAKADSLGWAYYDPNATLGRLLDTPCILQYPNLTDPTNPFGYCFSLDGVHPAKIGHQLIVNDLIAAVNTKYSTTIPTVTVSTP